MVLRDPKDVGLKVRYSYIWEENKLRDALTRIKTYSTGPVNRVRTPGLPPPLTVDTRPGWGRFSDVFGLESSFWEEPPPQ